MYLHLGGGLELAAVAAHEVCEVAAAGAQEVHQGEDGGEDVHQQQHHGDDQDVEVELGRGSVSVSASKRSIRRFVITEKTPTRAFSWLEAGFYI